MIGIGFIVSTWVGYGSSTVPETSDFSWRFPLGFQTIPCAILIAGILFFPESPRHLVEKDRPEEALRVLRRLHYNGHNDEWIQAEFNEIKLTIEAEKTLTAPGWRIMFKVKPWRTRLWHALLVQVFTQMTGINVIGYYQVNLLVFMLPCSCSLMLSQTLMYETLGITGKRSLLVAGIYNVVGPIFNFLFITFLLDRIGRKKPLLFGTVGITVALICEAIIGSQVEHATGSRKDSLSIAGVFFLFCVSCIFSCSFGPISWVYVFC